MGCILDIHLVSAQNDGSLIHPVYSAEYLYQGGFACPVFTDKP